MDNSKIYWSGTCVLWRMTGCMRTKIEAGSTEFARRFVTVKKWMLQTTSSMNFFFPQIAIKSGTHNVKCEYVRNNFLQTAYL